MPTASRLSGHTKTRFTSWVIASSLDAGERKAYSLQFPNARTVSVLESKEGQSGISALYFRPAGRALGLLNEPDRHRVAIKFPIAGLDGGDDDEDRVQDPKDRQENEADQDQAKDRGDNVVDGRFKLPEVAETSPRPGIRNY